jgi:hypothetical protein
VFKRLSPLIRHIHLRYGYDQSPQIPDPRAPEYEPVCSFSSPLLSGRFEASVWLMRTCVCCAAFGFSL